MSKLIDTQGLFSELKSVMEAYNNCDAVKPFVVGDLIKKLQQLQGQPISDLTNQKILINACRQIATIAIEVRNSQEMHPVKADSIYQKLFAARQSLESLPTVEPERTAEKIEQEPIGISKIKSAMCSECGTIVIIGAKYCWTCGARFKEEPNE